MSPALELRQITKRFSGVVANDRISLSVDRGEIRALVGENGAGKSTLMNILYGLIQPDEGEISIAGERRAFRSPLDAIRAGLGMVHQHFMLFPSLSVAENVVFGQEPHRHGVLDRGRAEVQVHELATEFALQVDPRARVADLPVGVRQRVEILKMLYRGAEILILDEPTAVLTPGERDALFRVLRALADSGKTVVFITHKIPEILALADTATVLRDGKVTGTVEVERSSAPEICRLMVGREVDLEVHKTPAVDSGKPILRVDALTVPGASGREAVRGLDFEIRAGEIVGIAGAAGNGQTELVEAISGRLPVDDGRISLLGLQIDTLDVQSRRRAGLSRVPEDRDGDGLALGATVGDNLLMGYEDQTPFVHRGVLSRQSCRRHRDLLLQEFGIKTPTPDAVAGQLSGGNRQKLVLARELHHQARLLIAEQPTRGVDIGATEQIYDLLIAYRDAGHAVLLVSTDLSEILALADRILVLFEGRLAGEVPADEASEERLGLLMTGSGDLR